MSLTAQTAPRRRSQELLDPPPGPAPVLLHRQPGRRVLWHEVSPRKMDLYPRQDKAYETSMLEVLDDSDQQIAYLAVSFTTRELAAQVYPRPLAYANSHGWCLNFDDPAKVWVHAHLHGHVRPASMRAGGISPRSYQLSELDLPADPSVIEADLTALDAQYADELACWIEFTLVPSVAYAHVEPDLQRQGIGTQMYLLAARQLARTGRVLRASGLQSNSAQHLWRSLQANPDVPTGTITLTYPHRDPQTYPTIDCRR